VSLNTTDADPNADSYAAVADADAYWTARGEVLWTGATSVKEAALRRATVYFDNQYRQRWKGIRATQFQSLAWPRVDGYRAYGTGYILPLLDLDGFLISTTLVPLQIKNATIEAALLTLTGVDLQPTLTSEDFATSVGKSVGTLRKDIVYRDGISPLDRFTAIEGILRGLVKSTPGSGSGTVRMVRA